jgi:predicted nucleic acid-binding protein
VTESIIVDTGPLIALLSATDQHHAWAREQFGQFAPPLLTCEGVLSEAQFLLARSGANPLDGLEMVKRGALKITFHLEREVERLLKLQRTYRNLPMSLADACLVRMTELEERSRVFTTDFHFSIYRRNDRQVIPLLRPPET